MQAFALRDRSPEAGRLHDSLRAAREAMRAVLDEGEPRMLAAGLGPALEELCSRWPNPPISLTCPAIVPVPAAVSSAAYFVIAEALANVAQHAYASAARVTVLVDAERLAVRVEDDGVGIDHERPVGIGLSSMRGRALELDGDLTITAGVRGTNVVAHFPLSEVAP